jgi:hypothetical protein
MYTHVHQCYMKFHILICRVKKLLQQKPEVTKHTIPETTTLFVITMKNITQAWGTFRTYPTSAIVYWLALRLPHPKFHTTVPFGSSVICTAKYHYNIVPHWNTWHKMNMELLKSFASTAFEL